MNHGDQHATEAHAHGTHELVHVLAGTVTITVADESVELSVGDSMSFRGDVDHGYSNHHGQAARFALTVYEPGVGAPANPDAASDRRTP
jgi:quercetin dioxygenase-like cupin family protein